MSVIHAPGRRRGEGLVGRSVLERAGVRLVAAAGAPSLTVRAFLASRLLVLLAGVGGVLTVTKRTSAAAVTQAMHQLGQVGYVLAGSVDRFDSSYYLSIANHGFGRFSTGRVAFFPVYPLLIRALSLGTRSGVVAGVVISAGSFLAVLVFLHRLTELELGRRAADATVLLVAFAPLSFFFTAVYTESLFLLLSVASVLAARRERWMLAGMLAVLGTLTRPTGVLLAVPLVIMRFRTRPRVQRRVDPQLGWALIPIATLTAYMMLLRAEGYPWLAPFRAQAKWARATVGPIGGIVDGIKYAVRGVGAIANGSAIYHPTLYGPFTASAENVLLCLVLLLAGALLVLCLRRLPLAYGAYAAVTLAVCLSSPRGANPLGSLDRFVLTIFPLWMAAGAWVAKHRLERVAVAVGSILLIFYTVQFSSWSFIA
jgi:hypothetical protein